ncbi:MAG: NAD(P)/FAD-dependent oxidoreductase [Oscillospiraceae bacterium]|jgi:thioredoxin reductase (NADPH)|nr:NAD(P)/FAD-dependent oxidoreductase [Oscillospiraceae bacterium]
MPDVIIMGGGPAGISAALYTARAGLATLILASGAGALEKADQIENYYGFAEPVSGKQLLENGIAQAKRLGVQVLNEEVVGLSYDGEFLISTKQNTYRAPFAVMATGASRKAPKIPGLAEFEGKGVSYCAVCDGFFYRKKPVAVLGAGDYAMHEASELLPIASSVTILTDGKEPQAAFPKEMTVKTEKIAKLSGGAAVQGVQFEDGTELAAAGLFVAVGVAGSADLARKVGAQVDGVSVAVDNKRRTNVPGLYAAGDCTGGLLQISKAVCDGALAGTDVIKEFRKRAASAKA